MPDALYLVTGGAGFIGSHICEFLLGRGSRVRVLDNFSTGKKANVEPLRAKYPGLLEVINGDILDKSALIENLRGVEAVFHEAAVVSVQRSVEDPLECHRVNLQGTLGLFEASRQAGVRKVVFASSTAIYGDSEDLPKREDMNPHPLSPYAVTKYASELYASVYSRVYGLPVACLRYFNVFGPRQDPTSEYAAVIPKFITRILSGRPPVIFGDGEQSRDFVYVGDVARANVLAIESAAAGVSLNIATGTRYSLNQLAASLNRLMATALEPVHEQARIGEVRHSEADISRARSTINFVPQVSFEEGLKRTIEWYRLQEPAV